MNTKLENITTQYRKFNENQALTEGQLNEFIDYFEDQDRLSRTRLSGVGLVCGFESTYSDLTLLPTRKDSQPVKDSVVEEFNTLVITQGAGVTTGGDLITLRQKIDSLSEVDINFESMSYKYYKEYEDTIRYEHFRIDGKQVPLLEVITQSEYDLLKDKTGFKELSFIRNIYDKIIILYLESYSNEESPCEDADCDNTGAEQVSNLKVLLADFQTVSDLLSKGDAKDTIYNVHNAYEDLFDHLPKIEAKRVILDATVKNSSGLRAKFQAANMAIADLSDGFNAIAATFNISVDLKGESLIRKLKSLLEDADSRFDDYQYRYDLLKDLIDTYNEIKGLILDLNAECCPGIASFPKHLMLGPVGATLKLGEYTRFRHSFYNSPVTTNDDENYERIVMLANRFVQKINGFQTYIGPVKITPSNLYVRLGEKAIPYYYNVDQSLLEKWNFEKTKTDRETYNLSYHTVNLATDDYVQNPLNYNIDDNDFYRVEGHLTLPFETAYQNINDLKKQYGLAFDVIVLLLNEGEKTESALTTELKTVSIEGLRKQLVSISSDISKEKGDTKAALLNLSKLDTQLKLLNKVEFAKATGSEEEVTIVKEDPKKEEIATELLSEFLERKSGLEHRAGVEPGGSLVLIAVSAEDNQVIADFALPYLCCSKKDPVFLALPANKLCQNDAPMAITIVPLDGQVKAFVNGVQIPAIKQSGGQTFFDPTLVGAAYFGQTITFTVNDDAVDAQLVVYEEPNVSVTTGNVSYGTDTSDPDATVDFHVTVPGNITGLTYTFNFGDGTTPLSLTSLPSNGIVKHKYDLVAGQEDVFNPTLTVTNANGCSKTVAATPIKLKGQMTVVCLNGMKVVIQYRDGIDPGHTCNDASFNLKGNGILIQGATPYSDPKGIIKGNIHLSNTLQSQDAKNYPPNVTSGFSRYNAITITQTEAQQIASLSPDGFVKFSLECALGYCHTGVAFTQIFLANATTPIYSGYPNGNFLEINPCTGVTR